MKQTLLMALALLFLQLLSTGQTNKRAAIIGTWRLQKHVAVINDVERTCNDSTQSGLFNRNHVHWVITFNKKNTYVISDGSKKRVIKGQWTLSADKEMLSFFKNYTYPTSDDGIPVFPQEFIIDRTLKLIGLTKTELIVNENFCSPDTIGISYYQRLK